VPRFIRFCPDCDTQLGGPDAHGKWQCHNDDCPVINVIFPPIPRNDPPVRVIRASRPRLHYYTTVLQYSNTIQQEEGEG